MGGPGGGGGGYATTGSIGATAGSGGDAVDECGLRFLLAMRHHTCLMRSLPPKHRSVLEEKVSETGLSPRHISPSLQLSSVKWKLTPSKQTLNLLNRILSLSRDFFPLRSSPFFSRHSSRYLYTY